MRGMVMAMLVLGVLCGADALAAAQPGAGDLKFAGTFVWNNKKDKSHPINAVFTPNGEKKWNVVFTFNWGKGPQTWKGTAEGTLKDGEIKGDVKSGDEKRNFNFTGAEKNGAFECTHNELKGGKPLATGSMTIKKE